MKRPVSLFAVTSFIVLAIAAAASGCKEKDQKTLDPVQRLMEGNKRFAAGKPVHPDETIERIRQLKKGQHPFAIVVSCSDSRVPPELIFDQGLGDIFSVRTAGNVIGDYELGSIEYAVEKLNCNTIIVLGHRECGAIEAFMESGDSSHPLNHIRNIIDYIGAEKEEKALLSAHSITLNKAIDANIRHGVNMLKLSEPLLKKPGSLRKTENPGCCLRT